MVAPLVAVTAMLATALAGCTSSSAPTPTSARSGAPTSSAAASVDPAARSALRDAVAATRRVRSYSFTARTVVEAKQAVRSVISGRVVRGNGVTYRLATGSKHTQVVRIPRGTYVREVPGRWSRLKHPRRVMNPTASLLKVLRGLIPTAVERAGHGRLVRGALPPRAAAAADLPHDGAAQVTVRLDRRDRVAGLVIRTHTAAGSNDVAVVVTSSYRNFGHAKRVRPPV